MKKSGKIHFIHHLEKLYSAANLGDWICCPYYYYEEYFSKYSCVLHSEWAVLWHEIEKGDVVIVGGGGLLDNSDELNRVLNRIIEKCNNVIIWGAGTHKYNENNIFSEKTASERIMYERLALVGVRDYEHPSGLPYLPCVSCMNPAFLTSQNDVPVTREIGTIKSALESSFAVQELPSFVTNAEPIGTVVNYILSSRAILVNSYHGAFWTMLMRKKAVLPATRLGVDKYKYFRYPVGFYEGDKFNEHEILEIVNNLPEIPNFLEESRRLTEEFFLKCKDFIEDKIKLSNKNETLQIISKRNAQLEFTVIDMWNEILRLNGRIANLEKMNKTYN